MERLIRPYIPFTALNSVQRIVDGTAQSILDVGCGKGEPIAFINRNRNYRVVGVDIFKPSLSHCRKSGYHDNLILADVRNLPFKPNSFDVVICMEVLEHLDQIQGERLLRSLENIARKQVIISSPLGDHDQDTYDGNPYQQHKYIWTASEVSSLGYNVIGIGIRGLGGKSGIQSPIPRILHPLLNILWVLAGPIAFISPKLAGAMVATKRI